MENNCNYSLVKVIWIDSRGIEPGWVLKEGLEELEPVRCQSVGFLYSDNKDYVTIVQTLVSDQLMGRMTIPKCAILEIVRL